MSLSEDKGEITLFGVRMKVGKSGHAQRIPWTKEEHKQFLIGLQKGWEGDWKGICEHFVKTRTPIQVASHARNYFRKLNSRRHHAQSVAARPMEDARNLQQTPAMPVARPASVPRQATSNAHALSSMQARNPFKISQNFLVNNSSRLSSRAIVPSTAQGHSRFQVMSAYDNGDNILVLLKKNRVCIDLEME